ncbi:MAG: hypothetical protein B0D92_07235 [Spirochaeta sp. LUC14_002_19_P3]|nr:MAG: hypothetical protein B0D92_07235 [Spirochaeta sp. LUC14_002_19_P3]
MKKWIFLLIGILYVLIACTLTNVDTDNTNPTPDASPPVWNMQPAVASTAKGQFSLTEGAVDSEANITYYYAESTAALPADNTSWEASGWLKIENPQQPVYNLSTGGNYSVAGLALSGEYKVLSNRIEVVVGVPVAPTLWTDTPVLDTNTSNGVAHVIGKGTAVNAKDPNTGDVTPADPEPDYRYYFAAYTLDENDEETAPLIPEENKDALLDWVNGGWKPIQFNKAYNMDPGKYDIYAVASNNGGSVRLKLNSLTFGGVPSWPTLPTVETMGESSFRFANGGAPGGYPLASADDANYYYGLNLSPPEEADWGLAEKWVEKGWKPIKIDDTVENVVPASRNYQFYGVASNQFGAGVSEPLKFTVYGLGEFVTQASNAYYRTVFTAEVDAEAIPYISPIDDPLTEDGTLYNGVSYYGFLYPKSFNNGLSLFFQGGLYASKPITHKTRSTTNAIGSSVTWATDLTYTKYTLVTDRSGNFYLMGGILNNSYTNNSYSFAKSSRLFVAVYPILIDAAGYKAPAEKRDRYGAPDLKSLADNPGWYHNRWEPRIYASGVFHNNKIYLFGGENEDGAALNDVWVSEDGRNWENIANAPWPARSRAAAVVYKDRIWVSGGKDSTGVMLDDVWSSSDGISWLREPTVGKKWGSRMGHSFFVYQDRLWLIGGKNNITNFKDVWHSFNGREWTKVFYYYANGAYKNPGVFHFGNIILIKDDPSYTVLKAVWIGE